MHKPLREIRSEDHTVWMTQPSEVESLVKKRETAFTVAKGKFADSGNVEIAMQIAEAFGRGLFAEHIKEKPERWTVKEWLESAAEQVFNPLGTGATITKLTDEEAQSLLFKCSLHEAAEEPHIASLFTYGYLRGMFLSAFPDGEVLMRSTMAHGAPMSEFVFKATATDAERLERERVKNSFTTMKRR